MTRIVPRLELGGSPPRSDVSDPAVSARPAAAWCADRGAEKVDGAVERIKKKFNRVSVERRSVRQRRRHVGCVNVASVAFICC